MSQDLADEQMLQPVQEQVSVGSRVQFHDLLKAPALNDTFGVVVRHEAGRLAVRKEVTHSLDESPVVMVRTANLREVPRRQTLSALQELVDSAPAGAKVTLPRGMVALDEDAESNTLVLNKALALHGMGSRAGGTALSFCVEVGDEVVGERVELCGLHIRGEPRRSTSAVVDVAPRDVRRVLLRDVAISAPSTNTRAGSKGEASPALFLDEISPSVPSDFSEAAGRILLEDCWVRGGGNGVVINAVGCQFRRCRVQGAQTFGVRANATFSISQCTIGKCATGGSIGGGILARASVIEVRRNGFNENRVQRDQNDKDYGGYQRVDCRGCKPNQCTCSAMMAMALASGHSLIKWGSQGAGKWQKPGQ